MIEANGVRVILVGNTNIKKAITTTNFADDSRRAGVDVTVNLPTGPHSALAANGNLCTTSLVMPTTITAQNGKVFKQNTNINVGQLRRADSRAEGRRQRRLPHRPHVLRRTDQRQRGEPLDGGPPSGRRHEVRVA